LFKRQGLKHFSKSEITSIKNIEVNNLYNPSDETETEDKVFDNNDVTVRDKQLAEMLIN
jgi:hypothetical protein